MSLRSIISIAAASVLVPSAALPQTADDQAVLAVVQHMFDGMRAADTTMVRAVFAPGARFASARPPRGAPPGAPVTIAYDSVDGWIRNIANSNRRWDEQIYDVQVRVDGDMALVWAPYTFYLDKAVRHCGIDAFALLKDASGWKITQLSDTQRRETCPDPLRVPGEAVGEVARLLVVTMKNALRNLVVEEERFFADKSRYTGNTRDLSWKLPPGVALKSLVLNPAGNGWTAIVVSDRLSAVQCGIGVNAVNPVVATVGEGEPACR